MEYDLVIVGGGPAGLSAAIRAKQRAAEQGHEISVCVVEKGSDIGAHVLSGNVFEPRSLSELIPEWKEKGAPLATPVAEDKFFFLTKTSAIPCPVPPSLHNDGNYIISLGALCKWLSTQAEELGVEIYPGFSASEVLFNDAGAVVGIATSDMGIGRDGKPKDTFQRGMELRGKQTLFAEGVRGSCSELIINKFNLRKSCDPQTYGLGLKEVWKVPEDHPHYKPGLVVHTVGHPAPYDTWFGTFMYHAEGGRILLGAVVGLDYPNPWLSPYQEFQTWKQHPAVRKYLEGGECISYGARCINEGGYQSIPKLTFPGGALIGCSAGFLNVPKIKGSHTAMKSGMLAAETVVDALVRDGDAIAGRELDAYESALRSSWVADELYRVRNVHPAFKFGGLLPFLAYGAIESFVLKGRLPFTLHNMIPDHLKTKKASECTKIEYPKPDGVLSFDLLSNLQRSGVHHEEDQPSHLRVRPELADTPVHVSYKEYAAPETRFCPARVYEFVEDEQSKQPKLVINKSNCVHCKTCAIKTPAQYIDWTVPEGGGGPNYENM